VNNGDKAKTTFIPNYFAWMNKYWDVDYAPLIMMKRKSPVLRRAEKDFFAKLHFETFLSMASLLSKYVKVLRLTKWLFFNVL
jgi:hypothetical protein